MPGGIEAAGAAVGGLFNYLGTRQTNKMNLKISREANAYNTDMWNLQNAYNDPSAQMERLKKAGLNPNLMYGNGASVSVGNASSPQPMVTPKFTSPIPDVSQLVNVMSAYAQYKKTMQDTQLVNYNSEMQRILLENYYPFNKAVEMSGKARLSNVMGTAAEATSMERIESMKNDFKKSGVTLTTAQAESILKSTEAQFQSSLKEYGGTMNDALWARIIMMVAHKMGITLTK